MWYRPYTPTQGAGPSPYMYTEYTPYEWPQMPPPMPPMPPMHRAYAQQPHHQQQQQHPSQYRHPHVEMPDPEVALSAEVRIARGFHALVKCMLRKMTRSLAQSPVDMCVVPFAAFEPLTQLTPSKARDGERADMEAAADIRGAAPSVIEFQVELPISIEDALTKQIGFVDWMITQSATNVHHSHHAAFTAALSVMRAELRFTRLVHRHQTGTSESIYGDNELQPLPGFASAFAGLEHCAAYLSHLKVDTKKPDHKKKAADTVQAAISAMRELKVLVMSDE